MDFSGVETVHDGVDRLPEFADSPPAHLRCQHHLDPDAMEALEHALRSYDGAMLVVSHDGAFLDAIGVERRVELRGRAQPS